MIIGSSRLLLLNSFFFFFFENSLDGWERLIKNTWQFFFCCFHIKNVKHRHEDKVLQPAQPADGQSPGSPY